MTVEIKPNFILITDIIAGILVHKKYIGYTEKQAVKLFKKTKRQVLRDFKKAIS